MAIWRDNARRAFFTTHRVELDQIRAALVLEQHDFVREAVHDFPFEGFCPHCFESGCNGSCENDE